MTESTQEDVGRLDANTTQLYMRLEHPQVLVSVGSRGRGGPQNQITSGYQGKTVITISNKGSKDQTL